MALQQGELSISRGLPTAEVNHGWNDEKKTGEPTELSIPLNKKELVPLVRFPLQHDQCSLYSDTATAVGFNMSQVAKMARCYAASKTNIQVPCRTRYLI